MTQVAEQQKFGVRCVGCPVWIREVCDTPDAALTVWFKRKGTVSAAGGRAGKGKCSWRKRRSCRKNFRLARQQKKSNQLRNNLLIAVPWVWALRKFEEAVTDEERTRAWASLKAMESKVMGVPSYRPLCKLLQKHTPHLAWASTHDDPHSETPVNAVTRRTDDRPASASQFRSIKE